VVGGELGRAYQKLSNSSKKSILQRESRRKSRSRSRSRFFGFIALRQSQAKPKDRSTGYPNKSRRSQKIHFPIPKKESNARVDKRLETKSALIDVSRPIHHPISLTLVLLANPDILFCLYYDAYCVI
jgi:hypothetical protein